MEAAAGSAQATYAAVEAGDALTTPTQQQSVEGIVRQLGEQEAKDLLLTIVRQFPFIAKLVHNYSATTTSVASAAAAVSDIAEAEAAGAANFEEGSATPDGVGGAGAASDDADNNNNDNTEDLDQRKLFIRGLPWVVTDKAVRKVFQEFGEIADCTICVDRVTKRSRGYVVFFFFFFFLNDS